MGTATLSVRMDGRLKESASRRLEAMGTTASEAVRRLFEYVNATGAMPDMEAGKAAKRSQRLAGFDDALEFFDSRAVSFGDPDASWSDLLEEARANDKR